MKLKITCTPAVEHSSLYPMGTITECHIEISDWEKLPTILKEYELWLQKILKIEIEN